MGRVKNFLAGFFSCFLLVACAGAFPFRYYPYDISNHKLIGDKPENDVSDSACDPTASSVFPCTCMFTPEFFKLKADDEKAHKDLEICQQGNPPNP